MQIIIKGKQMEVTPSLRQHIEQKVQRLSRLLSSEARIEVTVTEGQTRSARDRYSVQLAVSTSSQPIRSEVSAVNASMALDLVLDKVTAQLGRHKDRKTSLRRHRINPVNVLSLSRTGTLSPLQDEQVDEDQQPSLPITEERNEEIWLSHGDSAHSHEAHERPGSDRRNGSPRPLILPVL